MYEFTAEMHEISGFGGGYEQVCRKMLAAGLKWLDEHPDSDPQFRGCRNLYGVIFKDNDDAKTLSKVVVDAADGDCTGAMHQAVISHCLWIRQNGWDAYVKQMSRSE